MSSFSPCPRCPIAALSVLTLKSQFIESEPRLWPGEPARCQQRVCTSDQGCCTCARWLTCKAATGACTCCLIKSTDGLDSHVSVAIPPHPPLFRSQQIKGSLITLLRCAHDDSIARVRPHCTFEFRMSGRTPRVLGIFGEVDNH